jgi:hypothetical protein
MVIKAQKMHIEEFAVKYRNLTLQSMWIIIEATLTDNITV